ncbi:GDSL esterase/lipase At5g45920-like [Zingiber officinale]|uniref:GDSL esterase/lipase At5g45920-like n=1 Tax=Zingiber officinale TaxID=94328 RepID=UPI001C4A77C4|nr:GDSL esterase/lipase At5g45920-like [Zingiber officinale]XP_042389013.1 GDSL esterase/lipase At5g45920-like [Zingiber officinale]
MLSRSEVVLFGDSLTQGSFRDGRWGAALSHHLSPSADVLARGYSGYNTRQALMVIHRAMEGVDSPAAFTVFFGANDAALPDRSAASVHVPLFEYTNNLRAICAFIKAKWPSTLVILITPPPIDEEGRLRFPYGNRSGLPERTNLAAGTYAGACIYVAKQLGLPVIDIWTKMQQFSNWEKTFLWDGLHFTDLGNHFLFQEVVKALRDHGVVDY